MSLAVPMMKLMASRESTASLPLGSETAPCSRREGRRSGRSDGVAAGCGVECAQKMGGVVVYGDGIVVDVDHNEVF